MIRILLIAILAATVLSFPGFRNDIPNGNNVPNPCAGQSGVWQGVGHDGEPGGGPRNPFGLDFKNAGFKWTKELCQKDSDQDGRSNGDELGDKNCTWSKGGTPSTGATGHPGICEPMTDAKCTTLNKDIKCTQNKQWCIFGHCI